LGQNGRVTTILVAEDSDELAEVIGRELGAAGYDVVRAASGRVALSLHRREQPSLVVLDWMLPELDGLAVLRELRASPAGAATPVLMLTARGEEADRVIGLEVGADDYLTKPFSMRELLARIRALLRRDERLRETLAADRRADDGASIDAGPLRLDPAAHTATLGGAPLDLTPQEFTLLHLMARNPGRAFSRSYLLDAVWGVDAMPGDRSVDNAVLRLRRKLGPEGELIETVWGVGYRFRAAPAGTAARGA
jgi:DNA-binding response OmpR family regulator